MSHARAAHSGPAGIELATAHETWRSYRTPAAMGLVVLGLVVWTYFDVWAFFVYRWATEPDYIYGFLVIPFALVLLWSRHEHLTDPSRGSGTLSPTWWALVPLAAWAGLRWWGTYWSSDQLIGLSVVPLCWGIALLVGGRRALHWSWSAGAFLAFMVPLPPAMAEWARGPLRQIGTSTSVFIIQSMGLPASPEGTVISLPSGDLGVVDACSGIRMLMLFFAVCTGAAMLLETRPWQKVVIVVSAIPIAIIANVLRITVTAALHEMVGPELANRVFHDLAGWFMMPLAILILAGELALIRNLFMGDEQPATRASSAA